MSELKPHLMTADEAISALEMCQALMLFDPMTGETHEICEENKDNQDLYNACSLAISALRRAQPVNEPLTLEELSKMSNTDWAWVVFPELAPAESGWYRAKRLYDTYSKSHYSKTWLAYRRKPEGELL